MRTNPSSDSSPRRLFIEHGAAERPYVLENTVPPGDFQYSNLISKNGLRGFILSNCVKRTHRWRLICSNFCERLFPFRHVFSRYGNRAVNITQQGEVLLSDYLMILSSYREVKHQRAGTKYSRESAKAEGHGLLRKLQDGSHACRRRCSRKYDQKVCPPGERFQPISARVMINHVSESLQTQVVRSGDLVTVVLVFYHIPAGLLNFHQSRSSLGLGLSTIGFLGGYIPHLMRSWVIDAGGVHGRRNQYLPKFLLNFQPRISEESRTTRTIYIVSASKGNGSAALIRNHRTPSTENIVPGCDARTIKATRPKRLTAGLANDSTILPALDRLSRRNIGFLFGAAEMVAPISSLSLNLSTR